MIGLVENTRFHSLSWHLTYRPTIGQMHSDYSLSLRLLIVLTRKLLPPNSRAGVNKNVDNVCNSRKLKQKGPQLIKTVRDVDNNFYLYQAGAIISISSVWVSIENGPIKTGQNGK